METQEKKIKLLALILLFSIIGILLFNIFSYHPILGYDAEAHDNYIDHLSRLKALDVPNIGRNFSAKVTWNLDQIIN